jgi:hypothetical protein
VNWEAIGAIGEVVGALGVIATLVYLAAQIRQNSNVVRSATRQAISTAQTELGLQLAGNPNLKSGVLLWSASGAASNPDQEARNDLVRRSILRMFENQFHQHQDGTFEDSSAPTSPSSCKTNWRPRAAIAMPPSVVGMPPNKALQLGTRAADRGPISNGWDQAEPPTHRSHPAASRRRGPPSPPTAA